MSFSSTTTTSLNPAPPSLLSTHASTLSYYKSALFTAETRIAALESTLQSLKSQLASTCTERDFYVKRVRDLDRDSRIHALELDAAHRARGEFEKEIARLRVEVEELRCVKWGTKRRDWRALDVGVQTDTEDEDEGDETVCECGRRRPPRWDRWNKGLIERKPSLKMRGEGGRGGQSAPPAPAPRRVRFLEASPQAKGKAVARPVSAPLPLFTNSRIKATREEAAEGLDDDEDLYELPESTADTRRARWAFQQRVTSDGRRDRTEQLRENLRAARERLERKDVIEGLWEDYPFDSSGEPGGGGS